VSRLRSLYPFARPYVARILLSLVITIAFTVFGILPPLVMRFFVDKVIEQGRWDLLLPVIGIIVLLPLIAAGIRFLSSLNIMWAGRRFLADVRANLYAKVLDLSMRYHGESASGSVVGRIMSDVNMLQRLLTGQTVNMIVDVVTFCFALSVAFTLSPEQAAVLCALLVIYVFVYVQYSRRIRRSTRLYRASYDDIGGRLQETVAGVRQVRIYNREEWESGLFLDRNAESLQKAAATRISSISMNTACMAIAGFGSSIIITLNAYFVAKGRMSYGDLLAFDVYVWFAISPAIRLTSMAAMFSETFVSVDRISEVLEQSDEIRDREDAIDMPRGAGAVEFRDVTFGYDEHSVLYDGLSFKVEPGQAVALVGRTGCGKTTLTSLLMRYWDIRSGQILIDGLDISTVKLRSLRRLFGVVLQDPVVFSGSVAENIAYGRPGASRDEIEKAARAAEIHDAIASLPAGYDTVLGARGVKLSVGEKQRLSIARALLLDPEILILDEATSSLDSESEDLIRKSLKKALEGRTSFVVAHRLSTIAASDQIIVMDMGRIVERGTHEELLSREDGAYRALHDELTSGTEGVSSSEARHREGGEE